jgi:hypothetical protein
VELASYAGRYHSDEFETAYTVTFPRDADGVVTGLLADAVRARDIRFERLR